MHAGRFRTIGKITTNLAHLGAGRFADLEFPLPPFSEQKRIADEVDRRLSVLAGVEKQIRAALEETSKLRVSLFHRAVAGNLVTQKKFDEPAAELLERVRIERESEHTKAKQKKPQKKSEMKMLSPAIVKEAIWKFSKERFSFEELSAILESDYDPLKDIIFELLEEAKPAMKQVFNPKAKQMEFQRIKP